MKKIITTILLSISVLLPLCAQDTILTASAFFQSVSELYGTIKDYEAAIVINANKTEMSGKVSFKRPNLLRMDFSVPDTQVIVFNGELLTIYLPGPSAILNQTVTPDDESQNGANLATPQGLTLMSRYYSIAYESTRTPIPLETDSPEMVIKLLLTRKNTSENFRSIILSIDPETKLIRRVEAQTVKDELFTFDFTDYILNQGISDQRFIYDAPSSANNYNNFLFSE